MQIRPASIIALALVLVIPLADGSVLQLAPPLANHENTFLSALSSAKDLATTHLLGKAIKSLNTAAKVPASACSVLQTYDPATASIADIFHAQRVATLFACEQEISVDYAKIQNYAKAVSDELNLPNLYYAIAILRKDKQIGEFRNQIIDNLSNAIDQGDDSLASSAFATLALIEAGGAKLGNKFTVLKNKIGLAKRITDASDEYDFNRIVLESGNVRVSSLVTRAMVSLCKTSQEALLSADHVMQLANFFLLSETNAVEDIVDIVQALAALNADMTSLPKPVSIQKSGAYPTVKFSMSDVFGRNVDSARFSIQIGDQIEDLDGSGEADLNKFNLEAGIHSYEVLVSGANAYAGIVNGKAYTIHKASAVKHAIQSSSVKVLKKGSSDYTADTANVALGDKLQVSFTVSPDEFQAHQAFVRFVQGKREGFAHAKYGQGVYTADVVMDKAAASVFAGASGKWDVELIVADQKMAKPIQSVVSSINVALPADLETPTDEDTQADYFKPKTLISHIFPEAEERPPQFVSLVFTALTLAPLLVLLVLWGIVGFNLKLMSLDLWTLIFHGGVGAIMGLYLMYWLHFNMFQTVRYLAILGLVVVVSGNRLLSNVANKRLQSSSENKKTK